MAKLANVQVMLPDGMTDQDLGLLLADALADFHAARGATAEEYVARRYPLPSSVYPEGPRRDAKVAEVKRRIEWARLIVRAGLSVTVTERCRDCGATKEVHGPFSGMHPFRP